MRADTPMNGTRVGYNIVVVTLDQHAAGPAAGFEFYEQMKGAISIDVPSTLGRTIAFRGYAASFMADATKFVKFV